MADNDSKSVDSSAKSVISVDHRTSPSATSVSIQIRTLGCTGVRNRNARNASIQNIILQLQGPQNKHPFDADCQDSPSQQAVRMHTPRPLRLRTELPEQIRQQLQLPRWRHYNTSDDDNENVETAKTEQQQQPPLPPQQTVAQHLNSPDLMPSPPISPVAEMERNSNDPNWCVRQHVQRLRKAQQQIKQHLEFDVAMDQAVKEAAAAVVENGNTPALPTSPFAGTSPPILISNMSSYKRPAPGPAQQPHCPITLKCTKEVAAYNTISEAFYRLDFCNAIRDIRRFNYICKLLHLLITQNLTSLSGCATKFLFNLLEQVAWQGTSNE